jgi:disulfide bond formation protein DsbB
VRSHQRTWGENAIGHVGIGAAFGLITFVVILVGAGLAFLAAQASMVLAIAVGVVFVLGVLLLGIYQSALSGIYSAVLYRHAQSNETPAAFQGVALSQAFAARR